MAQQHQLLMSLNSRYYTKFAAENPRRIRISTNKIKHVGAISNVLQYFRNCHLRSLILWCCRQSLLPETALRLQRLPDFVIASHCWRDTFPAGVFVVAVIATTLETEFVTAGAATQGAAANNAKTNKAILLISSSNSRLQHR